MGWPSQCKETIAALSQIVTDFLKHLIQSIWNKFIRKSFLDITSPLKLDLLKTLNYIIVVQ